MEQAYQKPRFQIIRHAGIVTEGITPDGVHVHRENTVWIDGRFIACCQYDNHFVFIDPLWRKKPDSWFALCSCGSPAVIVGSNAYRSDGSPSTDGTIKGEMLICHFHASTGKHADGSS